MSAIVGPAARRVLRLGGLTLVAVLAYAVWRPGAGEQRAVESTLHALADDVGVHQGEFPGERDKRVQAALETYFTDPVTVRHRDLPLAGAGRRALLVWGRLLGRYEVAELGFEHEDITLQGGRALVKLDLVLTASGKSGDTVDRRNVELGLIQQAGRWKIESVDVAARAQQQPEARP